MSAQTLEYEVFTLKELGDAISGCPLDDGSVAAPKLLSPKLQYYQMPWGLGPKKQNKYLFLMATAPLTVAEQEECWTANPENLRKAVGILELQWSPFELEENVVWLKYVSVAPEWQGQGIARQLATNMATVLKGSGCRLDRSRPSDEGLVRIKSYIDKVLDEACIAWTQSAPL
jgi:GNAT superfamily N-acetyltransferase